MGQTFCLTSYKCILFYFIVAAGLEKSTESVSQINMAESKTQHLKKLEDKVESLNQKLSSAEEDKKSLLQELDLLKMERSQAIQEHERLKSEFSELQASILEGKAGFKTQVEAAPDDVTELLQAEVLRLQQILLGMEPLEN